MEQLEVAITENQISFSWFPLVSEPDAVSAYTEFISKLCELAIKLKRVSFAAKQETGICYSTEITFEGSIWQKDDTKCENFQCKVISCKIATGRWEKLQFNSYHLGSATTSLSDGGG